MTTFTKDNARANQLKGAETKKLRHRDASVMARDVILRALMHNDTRVALEVAKEMGLFKQMASSRPDTDMAAQAIGALLAGASGTGDTETPSETQSVSDGSVATSDNWCKVCQGWHDAGTSHNGRRGDRAIARAEARARELCGAGGPGTETQAAAKGGVGEFVATQSHKIFPSTQEVTDSTTLPPQCASCNRPLVFWADMISRWHCGNGKCDWYIKLMAGE